MNGINSTLWEARSTRISCPELSGTRSISTRRGRLEPPDYLCYVLHRSIGNGLARNLRIGANSKEDLAAVSIQKRTEGLGRAGQLAGRPLEFDRLGLAGERESAHIAFGHLQI